MTNLSPAAQAVLDAYRSTHLSINNLAAALRAAAEFVDNGDASEQLTYWATELEGAS